LLPKAKSGSLISDFQPRHAIEVGLGAEGIPHHGTVQTDQGPITIDLKMYNDAAVVRTSQLELVFTNESGEEFLTHPVLEAVPAGLSERRLEVDFGLVGRYQANCRVRGGPQVDVADYLLVMRPLINVDRQEIVYAVDGKPGTLSAERIDLPWQNAYSWYAEPSQDLIVNDDGSIFVFAPDGTILCTRDGGRTWEPSVAVGSGFTVVPGAPHEIIEKGYEWDVVARAMGHMSVLADGSFLCMPGDYPRNVGMVKRSKDRGRSWQDIGEIPDYRQAHVGCPLELTDGTLIVPVGMPREGFFIRCLLTARQIRGRPGPIIRLLRVVSRSCDSYGRDS